MNMFARFDENPAMTLRVIKETKRYRRTDGRTDNVKTVYPLQTKFAGGIKKSKVSLKDCFENVISVYITYSKCMYTLLKTVKIKISWILKKPANQIFMYRMDQY